MFYARTRKDGAKQPLSDHCKNTGQTASALLKCIGLENTAFLSGCLHDMGKFKSEFQERLEEKEGMVIHTFTPVKYMLENFHLQSPITAEIIAYAAGAHHGLFNIEENGFEHRLQDDQYNECVSNFYEYCMCSEEICVLMEKATDEVGALIE